MKIAVYASAHGFGHASRTYEVARALVEQDENTVVYFTSHAPDAFFAAEEHPRIIRRRKRLDVGMKQVDSLTLDIRGTLKELDGLAEEEPRLIEEETAFLKENTVDGVLADLPPLVFTAAHKAGIPCWGMSNFSWDWIYEEYVREHPDFDRHVRRIRAAYAVAQGLFRLPFHHPMDAFSPIVDVPLAARVSALGREEARRRLGWRQETKAALFSFGGFRLSIPPAAKRSHDWIFISTEPSPHPGASFLHLTNSDLRRLGLRYCDLVAAADVVVSKPGYGIVSECIANRTALVYTPRGRFREYPLLEEAVRTHLPSVEIAEEDLKTGRWLDGCREAVCKRMPPEMDCNGATRIARLLIGGITGQTG